MYAKQNHTLFRDMLIFSKNIVTYMEMIKPISGGHDWGRKKVKGTRASILYTMFFISL